MHYTYKNQNLSSSTPIDLVDCTIEHFRQVSSVTENYEILKQRNWKCLPLNVSFEIGGDWDVSSTYKALAVHAECHPSCGVGTCGTMVVYQLQSVINVNQKEPIQYILSRDDIEVSTRNWIWYSSKFDRVNVKTDETLLRPFSKNKEVTSFRSEPFKRLGWTVPNSQPTTDFWIERSYLTENV